MDPKKPDEPEETLEEQLERWMTDPPTKARAKPAQPKLFDAKAAAAGDSTDDGDDDAWDRRDRGKR